MYNNISLQVGNKSWEHRGQILARKFGEIKLLLKTGKEISKALFVEKLENVEDICTVNIHVKQH